MRTHPILKQAIQMKTGKMQLGYVRVLSEYSANLEAIKFSYPYSRIRTLGDILCLSNC